MHLEEMKDLEAKRVEELLGALEELYRQVERQTQELDRAHQGRLRCGRGCPMCCMDAITVFQIEAEHIRRGCAEVLASQPHPEGRCAFLDPNGSCRIYEHRPYVCRTQGYPLRWIDQLGEEGGLAELRDICPLNDDACEPIEELPEESCWTLGPTEIELAGLQARLDNGHLQRVSLRGLFGGSEEE